MRRGVVSRARPSGTALARVLFGDVNPSGKLPVTFPASDKQMPARTAVEYPGDGDDVYYAEGPLVGYRWYDATGQQPLFPFGYGLSYTTFRMSNLAVTRSGADSREGDRDEHRTPGGRRGRPALRGIAGVREGTAAPARGVHEGQPGAGQSRRVTLTFAISSLASWDNPDTGWVLHRGTYRIYVGDSSRSLPQRASIHLG